MRLLSRLASRYKALIAEYGIIAVATHTTIFVAMLLTVTTAVKLGLQWDGATGNTGALGVAYLATQVTQPLRLGITAALTPLVAGVVRRRRAD